MPGKWKTNHENFYLSVQPVSSLRIHQHVLLLKYFVAGGIDSDDVPSNLVFQLSESGKNWTNTTMKYPRSYHGATTVPKECQDHCKVLKV